PLFLTPTLTLALTLTLTLTLPLSLRPFLLVFPSGLLLDLGRSLSNGVTNSPTMKKHLAVMCLLVIGILVSCSRNESSGQDQSTAPADGPLPPVETKDPNTDYKNASPGRSSAPRVKTTTPDQPRVVHDGLDQPWGIVQLPDSRILVNQKTDTMRIVSTAGSKSEPITGLPEVNSA